jgi:hypothetical protein
MEVFPLEGGLDPGGIMQVRFVFPSNLVNGFYNTTINMTTVDGEEPLDVKLRVACEAPIWNFNPNDYSYSMNLTLQPNIEGTLSKDRLDLVGAFVNGELRGVGKVQYFNDLDKHLVFLTVFSNNNDEFNKDTITFQIWDASACLIYGETVEKFEFYADSLFGTPLIPVVIYTNNMVLRKVQIHPGWNWLSYNINLPDPSINVALATLTKPQGNRINNQTTFSDYSTVFNTWLGNLLNLSHLTMYQLDAVDFDSISFVGTPIDPTTPMPLLKGWNWIGYLPQYGLPINQALNSLNPLNGDIIKSQLQFAQYVAGVGWIGNLGFLSSPNGYMIKLSNNGTLSYPGPEGNIQNSDYSDRPYLNLYDQNKTDLDRIMPLNENLSKWTVNPQLYEFNMNMIAIVSPDDQIANLIGENDEIGVFVGNELRGSGKALYIPVMDKYMVFITVYANKAGEILNFKWYDASENKEMDLKEKTGFIINGIWGRADNPSILHLNSTSSTADADVNNAFTLYPNPTANHLYIELESEIAEEIIIKVTDVLGKEIRSLRHQVSSGNNIIEWNQLNDMDAGVYWLKLANSKGESYQKFIIIR